LINQDNSAILNEVAFADKIMDPDVFMNRCKIMNDTLAWDIDGNNDPANCIDIDPETLYALDHVEEQDQTAE